MKKPSLKVMIKKILQVSLFNKYSFTNPGEKDDEEKEQEEESESEDEDEDVGEEEVSEEET